MLDGQSGGPVEIVVEEFYLETMEDKERFKLKICDDGPTLIMTTHDLFLIASLLAKEGYSLMRKDLAAMKAIDALPSVN